MALTEISTNFKGQTSTKVWILPVLRMIVCYSSPAFLVIRILDIKNSTISRGHPLGSILRIRLAFTAIPTNFQGQTSSEALIPHVLPMIMCYSSPSLLVIRFSNIQIVYIFCWLSLRPSLFINISSRAAQFKGQTSPIAHIPFC